MFCRARLCLLLVLVAASSGIVAEPVPGWRADWELPAGVGIDIDTQGYHFPTAIAFIPQPGDEPKDPLYFVTELRGAVKVVTNDRSVFTFAEDFFEIVPRAELPDVRGQIGMAGICLDPEHGYVFVTFAYSDSTGTFRNNIVRFETEPGHFGLKPTAQRSFAGIFHPFPTSQAHQVGNCQVGDGQLFVGVGDGFQADKAQIIDNLYGKILRMTLDGRPLPDNPFYDPARPDAAQNFVWSYGWRNPFSLSLVAGRLFAAGNGYRVDRFLKVGKGVNYLWDGSDRSIAANADFVFVPNIAPAQMTYYSGRPAVLPERFGRSFMLAASVNKPKADHYGGVFRIPYDLAAGRVSGTPDYLVRYVGERHQRVVGMAVGPDGLYFSALHPVEDGGAVLRLHAAADAGTGTLLRAEQPRLLMLERGCLGCHDIGRHDAPAASEGPRLDAQGLVDRLGQRLNSPEYLQQVAEIDALDEEPWRSYREARREVLEAEGIDRIRTWIKYRIMEPRFDTRSTGMPSLGVPEQEAEVIARYLLKGADAGSGLSASLARFKEWAYGWLPNPLKPSHLRLAAIAGFGAGMLVSLVLGFLLYRRNLRRSRHR